MYDETTGKQTVWHGKPLARKPGSTLCTVGKCKKGTPNAPYVLSAKNERAYEHYLECKATGNFPDDAMVRRNAAAIMIATDHADAILRGMERMADASLRAVKG